MAFVNVNLLRWSHNAVLDHFKDGKSVFETIVQLLLGDITTEDLPPLQVVQIGSDLYSLSNRRLYALREYARILTRLGKPQTVSVAVQFCDLRSGSAFTTENGGISVELTRPLRPPVFAAPQRGPDDAPTARSLSRDARSHSRRRTAPCPDAAAPGVPRSARTSSRPPARRATVGGVDIVSDAEEEERGAPTAGWRAEPRPTSQAPTAASGADRQDHVPIESGCRVRVHGLISALDLNGQYGTCDAWDNDRQRWHVCLDSGDTKAIRQENLQFVSFAAPGHRQDERGHHSTFSAGCDKQAPAPHADAKKMPSSPPGQSCGLQRSSVEVEIADLLMSWVVLYARLPPAQQKGPPTAVKNIMEKIAPNSTSELTDSGGKKVLETIQGWKERSFGSSLGPQNKIRAKVVPMKQHVAQLQARLDSLERIGPIMPGGYRSGLDKDRTA